MMRNTAATTIAITAIPPIIPPTRAPIGVDDVEEEVRGVDVVVEPGVAEAGFGVRPGVPEAGFGGVVADSGLVVKVASREL
jgi:hypothetical protein